MININKENSALDYDKRDVVNLSYLYKELDIQDILRSIESLLTTRKNYSLSLNSKTEHGILPIIQSLNIRIMQTLYINANSLKENIK